MAWWRDARIVQSLRNITAICWRSGSPWSRSSTSNLYLWCVEIAIPYPTQPRNKTIANEFRFKNFFDHPSWAATIDLYAGRTVFTRLWTLQEMSLPLSTNIGALNCPYRSGTILRSRAIQANAFNRASLRKYHDDLDDVSQHCFSSVVANQWYWSSDNFEIAPLESCCHIRKGEASHVEISYEKWATIRNC